MSWDNSETLREECLHQMRKKIVELRNASRDFTRSFVLTEPFLLSRTQQEDLLTILFDFAVEEALLEFPLLARRHAQNWDQFEKDSRLLREIVIPIGAVQSWNAATENVRFENGAVLPFETEIRIELLAWNTEKNDEEYRTALDRAIEKRVQVLIAPIAEELMVLERNTRVLSRETDEALIEELGSTAGQPPAPMTVPVSLNTSDKYRQKHRRPRNRRMPRRCQQNPPPRRSAEVKSLAWIGIAIKPELSCARRLKRPK